MMRHTSLSFSIILYLLALAAGGTTNALVLEPGVGLRSRDGKTHVVLFEHTPEHGTGGLVLNQATPLRLKDLQIPLFHQAFAENSLMLGGGFANDKETNVAITEVSTITPHTQKMMAWPWPSNDIYFRKLTEN